MFKVGDVVKPIRLLTRENLKSYWIEDDGEGWVDDLLEELNLGRLLVTRSGESAFDGEKYVMVMNWMLPAGWFELEEK